MTIQEKKTLLAQLVYAEQIALGNIPADLHTMTENEVHVYFDGYLAMLTVAHTIKEMDQSA